MNTRCAVGLKALALKQNHGFALGVREMDIFMQNPLKYTSLRNNKINLTDNVVLGQVFHKLLLQGAHTVVETAAPAQGYEKVKKLIDFDFDGVSRVNYTNMRRLEGMLGNFWGNGQVRKLFDNTLMYSACGGLFIEEYTGCECFFNADFILPEKGLVIDVKTCPDTSLAAIKAEIARFGYNRQAWWAKTGAGLSFEIPCHDFIFVFVGQNPPYDVLLYYAEDAVLGQARDEILPFIELYDEYFECGKLKN